MTDASAVRPEVSSSALSEAQVGPGAQMNVLAAARAAAELAAYVGVCPTCLAWEDPEAEAPEGEPAPGRAVCPTCGRCSVEWDLAQQIHDQVTELRGLHALDEAVQTDDASAIAGIPVDEDRGVDEGAGADGDRGAAGHAGSLTDADVAHGSTTTPHPGSPSQVPRRDA